MRVVIEGYKYLYGLTPEEESKIKDDLLVENPAYWQAKKYSRYSNIKIPKYLSYFEETKDYLRVPLGYKINAPVDKIEDLRVEKTITYPCFKLQLRKSQEEAVRAYLEDPEKGIISMPTGKGKSIVGIYLAYILKQRTLVIVHKNDLLVGWQKDIALAFDNKVDIGIIQGRKRSVGHITLATVQTLNKFTKHDWHYYKNKFGLIIVDEMHHTPASSYGVLSNFNAAYRVGLSATPERNDGMNQVMHFYLGDFAYVYEVKEGEEETDILPVEVIVQDSTVSYIPMVREVSDSRNPRKVCYVLDEEKGNIPITSIPFSNRPKVSYHSVEDRVISDERYQRQVIKDIVKEFKDGRNILVFFNMKEHCRIFSEKLKEVFKTFNSADKIVLYYGDSEERDSEIIDKIEKGEYRVTIATFKKATEGTNVKAWEVLFLVSSINNGMNVEQAVGRIRRVKTGKIPICRVYDYRHPRVYILSGHGKTRDARYKKLGFKVVRNRPMFSRGYKK